jgi:chromosome segregation ATPase
MSGDSLRSEHRLRIRAVTKTATELQALRRNLQHEIDAKAKEVEALASKLDTLSKVGELFRALMDKLVLDHVHSIESVVSEGLKTIFIDYDLSFEAEISQRYHKVAIDFFIRQQDQKMSIRAHPLEAFGGGPSSIASLILRVLAMRRLKKWPLLVLDETLAAVSNEYIEQTSLFLKELSAKTSISILLITHKPSFTEHADVSYHVSTLSDEDGGRQLQLHRENHNAS